MDQIQGPFCSLRQWGHVANPVLSPAECIANCRDSFLKAVPVPYPGIDALEAACKVLADAFRDSDNTYGNRKVQHPSTRPDAAPHTEVGVRLEQKVVAQRLWELYCCDSQYCGVDNIHAAGLDPNVNWLLNVCQGRGHTGIVDMGPPPRTYICALPLPCFTSTGLSLSTTTSTMASVSSAVPRLSDSTKDRVSQHVASRASTSFTTHSSTAPATEAPPMSTVVGQESHYSNSSRSGNVSVATKTVIILSALAMAVVGFSLIACAVRRRHLKKGDDTTDPHHVPIQHVSSRLDNLKIDPPQLSAASDPSQPTSTPQKSEPDATVSSLIPPLRRRDRKILVSVFNTDEQQKQRGNAGSLEPDEALPNLSLKFKRGSRSSSSSLGTRPARRTSSLRGADGFASRAAPGICGLSRASSTIASGSRLVTGPKPPKKDHKFLQAAKLQSPGPPPSRALPLTPTELCTLPPAQTGSSERAAAAAAGGATSSKPGRYGNVGVAIGVIKHNPARGVVLRSDSKDLCDLTEQYAQESAERGSWGSWSGNRGQGGVAVCLKSGAAGTANPSLDEAELERLGGKYR